VAKRTKFLPKQTPDGWRINVTGKFTESGKRERWFYRTKELATQAGQDLRDKRDKHGESAKSISASLAEQAVAAARVLEPFGVTLLEAAQRIAEIESRNLASATVEMATSLFTTAKETLSVKQTQAIRHMNNHLLADFPGRLLSTITGTEIANHLEARTGGAAAFNARLRLLTTFWRWCGNPNRGWCHAEALKHVERKEQRSGEIGVLSAAEARMLIQTAEKHYSDCVPGFAIALFTGIRQSEIERLEPEDLTEVGINVPIAANAKSDRRRFIEMPTPLAAWLKAYPIGETVLPSNWRRKEMAVRRLAGWRVWCDLLEPREAPETLPEWPQNALRHTAASVALALGKPIETLIFEHGHAEGVTTLKAHYIGRMTKKEALAIQSLGPHDTKLQITVAG
jgi:integrase